MHVDKGSSGNSLKPVMFAPLEEKEVRLLPSVARHYLRVGVASGWKVIPIDPVPSKSGGVFLLPKKEVFLYRKEEVVEEAPAPSATPVIVEEEKPPQEEPLKDPFAPEVSFESGDVPPQKVQTPKSPKKKARR